MSEPVHVLNIKIVINGDMTSQIDSTIVNIDELVSYSVRASFTGTPMGTLQLLGSDDSPTSGLPASDTFTIITDSITGVTQAGSYLVNVELPAYSWVKLQYIPSAGNGTLNARINGKRR